MITPKQQANIVARLVTAEVAKQAEYWRLQTAQQIYAIVLKNLHDHYGFTPKQLVQIFEQCTVDFEAIADKYVKIEDFYLLLAELGVKIADGNQEGRL